MQSKASNKVFTKNTNIKINRWGRVLSLIATVFIAPLFGVIVYIMFSLLFPIANVTYSLIFAALLIFAYSPLVYYVFRKGFDNLAILLEDGNFLSFLFKEFILLAILNVPVGIMFGVTALLNDTYPKFMFQNQQKVSEYIYAADKGNYTQANEYYCSSVTDQDNQKLKDIANYEVIVDLPSKTVKVKPKLSEYELQRPSTRRVDNKIVTIVPLKYIDQFNAERKIVVIVEGSGEEACIGYVGLLARAIIKEQIGSTNLDTTKDSAFKVNLYDPYNIYEAAGAN